MYLGVPNPNILVPLEKMTISAEIEGKKETIEVRLDLDASLDPVRLDPGQFESAVLNLAVNARDAMADGGKLTIETANAHVGDDYAREADMAAGQYVMIAVTDTGSGMAPDVLAKAFEPFFTTKPVGRGTGLGLSQVFGFVRQSRGHVRIYSELDIGTTVRLYLPWIQAPHQGEKTR